jgi:hypothetical protein
MDKPLIVPGLVVTICPLALAEGVAEPNGTESTSQELAELLSVHPKTAEVEFIELMVKLVGL